MTQQKKGVLKTILTFSLCLFVSQAWSISHERTIPAILSLEELQSIFKLISYPKPKLKNRQWSAIKFESKPDIKEASVESDYYEQNTNYKRYYTVWCDTRNSNNHWECDSPFELMQIRENSHTIGLKNKIPSAEVL
jgi:hypothetical protein